MEKEIQVYQHVAFPAWFYGPNGQASIFETQAEVPAGWSDSPNDDTLTADLATRLHADYISSPTPPVAAAKAPRASAAAKAPRASANPAAPPAPPAPPPPPVSAGAVDAAGTVFDPARHTGSKVKSGLWRLKTGLSRGPKEGEDSPTYVKPALDL